MLDKKRIFGCAIQKAIDNGWAHFVGEDEAHFKTMIELFETHVDLFFDQRELWCLVLYDNEFCRRFWETHYVVPIGKVWQFHQRNMIFSNDPFRYIKQYLS